MNGVLVVDKPAGPSSHDVVARVRRATGVRRVGHTGTLDPLATGVLPLVVGRATRLARFVAAGEKVYEARIRLGVATDTYDVQGTPVAPPDASAGLPDRAHLEAALAAFRGEFLQQPPPFSAKKIAGVRAYALARRHAPVAPAPVTVRVSALDVLGFDGSSVDLRIACSAGFYVRSLAHDLGVRLGCGAHLEALRRTRAGEFDVAQAVPLATVEAEGRAALARLVPLEALLPAWPRAVLTEAGAARVKHGAAVAPAALAEPPVRDGEGEPRSEVAPVAGADAAPEPFVRLFSPRGRLVALARRGPGGVLHPVVVLM
jgi:tRNA pseudouridine55 synthase